MTNKTMDLNNLDNLFESIMGISISECKDNNYTYEISILEDNKDKVVEDGDFTQGHVQFFTSIKNTKNCCDRTSCTIKDNNGNIIIKENIIEPCILSKLAKFQDGEVGIAQVDKTIYDLYKEQILAYDISTAKIKFGYNDDQEHFDITDEIYLIVVNKSLLKEDTKVKIINSYSIKDFATLEFIKSDKDNIFIAINDGVNENWVDGGILAVLEI